MTKIYNLTRSQLSPEILEEKKNDNELCESDLGSTLSKSRTIRIVVKYTYYITYRKLLNSTKQYT